MSTPATPGSGQSQADPAVTGNGSPTGSGYRPPGIGVPAGGQYPPTPRPAVAGQVPPPTGQWFPPPTGQAFPPPTGQAFPPPAVPTRNRKQRALLTLAVLVVVAIAVTFAIVHNQKTATTAANVGDCIKITSATLVNPKTEQAPCTDANAVFKVTETGGSDVKCDPDEPSYVEGKDTDHPSAQVCLRYNLAVGDCLDEGFSTSLSVPKKVDCSAPTSTTVKLVTLRLDTADESQCGQDTVPLALAKRNILYCFGRAS